MENFKLSEFAHEGENILAAVKKEFKNLQRDESKLPKVLSDDNAAVKLVLVGQYGAGKSSILKMLTGKDIEIGAKITTQNSTPYEWNGLQIVDTPGIHTEYRLDHDKITYEEINRAALLIFVVTNEGFDRLIAENFRKLAVEQKRAANMILVVNKMDRTALGNTPEQQQILAQDLSKIVAPYTLQNLYTSFLSTDDYFYALEEDDAEIKAELLERSGFNIFVDNLNKFVTDRKILAKISAPLYTIANEIRAAISASLPDKDAAALEQTIRHRKNILDEGKNNCLREVREIANQCKNEIKKIGRETVDSAINSGSQSEAENILKIANDKIAKVANNYGLQIGESMKNSLSKVNEEIKLYDASIFVKQVNENIAARVQKESSAGGIIAGGATATLGVLTVIFGGNVAAQFAVPATTVIMQTITQEVPSAFGQIAGNILGKMADGAATAALAGEVGPLSKIVGSKVGDGVNFLVRNTFTDTITTTVPKTITLPPTTMNKVAGFISQNAGKIGVALSVLGAAWSIYSIVKKNRELEEQAAEQLKIRNESIAHFNEVAEDVSNQLVDGAKNWMSANVDVFIKECNAGLEQLNKTAKNFDAANKNLTQLLARTEKLIGEIQACY